MNDTLFRAETLLGGATDHAAIDYAGAENTEFAALFLLLIVGAPTPNPRVTAAAGSFVNTAPEQGSEHPEPSRGAGVPSIAEAVVNARPGETRHHPNSLGTIPPEPSENATFASEMQLSQSIAPEPGLSDGAGGSSARDSENDNAYSPLAGVTPKESTRAKNPPLAPYSAGASITVNGEAESAAEPKLSLSIHHRGAPQLTSLARQSNREEPAQADGEAALKEFPFVVQPALPGGAAPETRTGSGIGEKTSDRYVPMNADDRAELFQPASDDRLARAPVMKTSASGSDTYRGNAPGQPAPVLRAEHPNLAGFMLKPVEQSPSPSEGELNSRAGPRISEIVSKVYSPDVQNENQKLSYQHNDSQPSGAPFENAPEIIVESAWRDAAPVQVAQMPDRVLARNERESQHIEWRPVIHRVVDEISGWIRIGKQQAVVQLDPPELGKVQIEIKIEGDKLAARILTETQESRSLIEAHLPELRQALVDNRVELIEVHIDTGSWSAGDRGDRQQTQQETNAQRQPLHVFSESKRGRSEERDPARLPSGVLEAGRVSMWA